MLACAAKVRLLKLQNANHEGAADQRNLTHAQEATYPANKQAKEEVANVGLSSSVEQSVENDGFLG